MKPHLTTDCFLCEQFWLQDETIVPQSNKNNVITSVLVVEYDQHPHNTQEPPLVNEGCEPPTIESCSTKHSREPPLPNNRPMEAMSTLSIGEMSMLAITGHVVLGAALTVLSVIIAVHVLMTL